MESIFGIDPQSPEFLAAFAVVLGALLIIFFERLFPYNRYAFFRKGFWGDFLVYNLMQTYVLGQAIFWMIEWIDQSSGFSRLMLVSDWPVWVQVGFFLVTHDLYIYLFHRLQHKNKYLWRTHEAHHSAPQVDWIAGARSHPLEILINQTIEFAPIILLGAAPEVALYKGAISGIWGMYIHSNIDVRSGWLQYVINGPEMHRWHHADDPEAYESNYATKFAFWDYLFGTAYRPDPQRKHAHHYGMGVGFEEYPLFGYWKQTFAILRPFRAIVLKSYQNTRVVADAVRADNVVSLTSGKPALNSPAATMRDVMPGAGSLQDSRHSQRDLI